MATAKKRGNKYRIRIYNKIENKYISFTAETKKEAEYLANNYLFNFKQKQSYELTVNEAINNYIAMKSPVLSPATVRNYKQIQQRYFNKIKNKSIYILLMYLKTKGVKNYE